MRALVHTISQWAEHKSSWLVLFATSLALEIAALYFQYGMGLKPCIMCIYQRTAMYGIVLGSQCMELYFGSELLCMFMWVVCHMWPYVWQCVWFAICV